jgi:hypothetical protein
VGWSEYFSDSTSGLSISHGSSEVVERGNIGWVQAINSVRGYDRTLVAVITKPQLLANQMPLKSVVDRLAQRCNLSNGHKRYEHTHKIPRRPKLFNPIKRNL